MISIYMYSRLETLLHVLGGSLLLAPFTISPLAPCSFFYPLLLFHFSVLPATLSFFLFSFFSCFMLLFRIFFCSMLLFIILSFVCSLLHYLFYGLLLYSSAHYCRFVSGPGNLCRHHMYLTHGHFGLSGSYLIRLPSM